MANQLTEEQLAERKKKNKKTFKIIGIVLIVLLLLRLIPDEKEKSVNDNGVSSTQKKEEAFKQKLRLDSAIEQIKNDKDIKTLKVEYAADSTLKIYLAPGKIEVTAVGINNFYNIMDIGNVSEIEVYKKDKIESSYGYRTQAKFDNFKKEFVSYDGSCQPVVNYIKEGMNDPKSFEHDKTFVSPLMNGNFEVKTVFRGKNAFGGVVLNSCFAEVTPTGNVVSFKMD
jgi:hypothetical protein